MTPLSTLLFPDGASPAHISLHQPALPLRDLPEHGSPRKDEGWALWQAEPQPKRGARSRPEEAVPGSHSKWRPRDGAVPPARQPAMAARRPAANGGGAEGRVRRHPAYLTETT